MTHNKLLSALPTEAFDSILSLAEEVDLPFATTVYNANKPIRHVYFPESGAISLLAAFDSGSSLDVGMVGREGMLGISSFLGAELSLGQAVVHAKGSALRIKAADFQVECLKSRALPRIVNRFIHLVIAQIAQSAGCYRFHSIDKRLARWLLMTGDRIGSGEFPMTHDFLSKMLGVRRESITRATQILRNLNVVSAERGNIMIVDRPGLEAMVCDCYAIIRDEELKFPVSHLNQQPPSGASNHSEILVKKLGAQQG